MQTYPTGYAESHRMAEQIFREILPRHSMAVREEQIALCHEVLDTLYNKEISLCEAGVGTGKTLAYLVACILWQMHRPGRLKLPIVISTSSVALQDAILTEYIPDLSAILLSEGIIREPITAVVRKGKERFVCDARLAERAALVQPSRKRQTNSLNIAAHILDMDHIPELSRYDRCRICVPQSCPRDCFMRLDCRYCAHCGAKMSGFMHTDRYKLADGSIREKVQPKYNCFQRGQRNKGGRDCDGQALYLAERVDAIVLKIVEEVFEKIRDTPYSRVAENRIRQESNLQRTKRAAVEKKIKSAQHALERFESEILKCLDGTSNFTEDMIAKQIRRHQQELDDAKAEYAELQNARLNEAAEIRKLRTYYDDFRGWAEEFDTAPLEMKRMILSHLIDRVEVGKKYQVVVKFNMKYRQFLECTAETYNAEIGA